uniref:Uncharacterized protein n=1 Tax=Opuntia streptacantha TaxID=393608 RepID=A0A7C8YGX8_OPUST
MAGDRDPESPIFIRFIEIMRIRVPLEHVTPVQEYPAGKQGSPLQSFGGFLRLRLMLCNAITSRTSVLLPSMRMLKTSPPLTRGAASEPATGVNLMLVRPARGHCVANTATPAEVTLRLPKYCTSFMLMLNVLPDADTLSSAK